MSRRALHLALLAVLGGVLPAAGAQTAAAGSPADVRFTPLSAGDAALHPRDPQADARRPLTFRSEGSRSERAAAAVARVIVDIDRDGLPADGQSAASLSLRLLDKDGQPVKGSVLVTLEHSGGRLLLPGARTDEAGPGGRDADRSAPGVQVRVEGGSAQLTLLAPAEPQDVRLRVTAGDEVAGGTISFLPDLRPMVAAGLLEGIVRLSGRVALQPARRGDPFERDLERWSRQFSGGRGVVGARAAVYLKGLVRGDVLLTASFDSDKDTRTRLLRDIRPDELYPVYGDSALRSFDARSAQRLYLRLDKGRSYALFGDFVTGDGFAQPLGQGAVASLKQRSLGQVNRSATGVRLHREGERWVGNVFAFRDSLRQVVEEFASQGSGPYGLRNNGLLEGSEKVEVLVRDRNQPSRIVEVRPLVRLVDYSFEPFSGRILLTSFLPAVDADLNPVSLRVTYEIDQGGEPFWVAGGDAQLKLGDALEIGGSALADRNRLGPYQLLSGNATWRLAERTALVVEVAQSTSTVNTNPVNQNSSPALAARVGEIEGRAARIELAHEGERTEARVFAGRSSPLFNNPAAPLQGGRDELYARGGIRLVEGVQLYGEALRSEDRNAGGGHRSAGALGLRWRVDERLTLDASLRRTDELIGTQPNGLLTWPYDNTNGLGGSLASGSGGGALGFGQQVLDPATGLPVVNQGGRPPATSSLAAGTRLDSTSVRLGAGWRLSERVRLGGEVEDSIDGDRRRRIALGADFTVAERTRLFGRLERQSGWVQFGGVSDTQRSAHALVFGVESTYWRDTQLFSEYRLRDAVAGRDAVVASGVRQFWTVAEGVRLNAAYEQLDVLSGASPRVNAVSLGLEHGAHELWRGSGRLEWRRSGDIRGTAEDERFDTTLLQAMVARKLARDWTLLARNYALHTDYAARGDVLQNRAQVGLAFRETDRNRVNALARIEHKYERDASNALVGELRSAAWIVSTHADWHPSRPWWLSGRVAAKWQRDRFEGGVASRFAAQLLSARMVYDITEDWDLGVMAAVQLGQAGARQSAMGVEAGYLLQQNLWLSFGINASGFAGDADLAGYEYTRRGAYVRLRFKFDENLFKGRDREVNRSLDR
jgi:hypothetical protein